MVVFSIFFGRIANISSGDIPYPVFSLRGLVLWTFFANAVSLASLSLVANANLLTKVYFPRLVIPLASTFSGLPDLGGDRENARINYSESQDPKIKKLTFH